MIFDALNEFYNIIFQTKSNDLEQKNGMKIQIFNRLH